MTAPLIIPSDIDFLSHLIDGIVDERTYIRPSEYIEKTRYLPKGTTPKPGYYEFDYTPYLREPFDLLAQDSGIQRIIFMKPAQIGYTVGFLQNAVLYHIGADPKRVQFVTADNALAEETVKTQINPMIEHAGLEDLIFAQSKPKGSRATGSTSTLKEYPGGYTRFVGAQNPDSARGRTFERNLYDEIDAWKDDKKEGSKIALFDNRSNAFSMTRKSVYGSTPLITQTSHVYRLYLEGDQRNFFVSCPHCGEMQVLKWHIVSESGKKCGIVFEHENGKPIYETVRYKCPHCEKTFRDYDKVKFMAPDVCEWRPTAEALVPRTASFWMNALYAPPGMYPWEKLVEDWVKCWDLKLDRMKDKEAYREFRNTKQGLPFEERGESISYEKAVLHRRPYPKGQILNRMIKEDTGHKIQIVLATVDVQKNNLFVDITGFTHGGRWYKIDFFSLDGVTEDRNSESWKALDDLICNKIYTDDDGRQYRISSTFIDSGRYTEYITYFCSQFSSGVYPIKGERYNTVGLTFRMMSKKVLESYGVPAAYLLHTTALKDRISYQMKHLEWHTGKHQPEWYPNFPEDLRDDYFKQFEAETKVVEYDKLTNKYKGSFWKQRHSGAENHAFDTAGYTLANYEMMADLVCREYLELDALDWGAFWEYAEDPIFYVESSE